MNINLTTAKLATDLTTAINESKLPAANILFVLQQLTAEAKVLYNQSVKQEQEAEKKELKNDDTNSIE